VEGFVTDLSEKRPTLHAYARRLSVRLWWLHGLRGLVLASAAAGLTVLLASHLAEPVVTQHSALWVWVAAMLTGIGAFAWALAPAWQLRGTRIARVVAQADAALAQRMRSALELSEAANLSADRYGSSQALLAAHLADVQAGLDALPTKQLVPWSRFWRVSSIIGLAGLAAFAWLSWQDGPLRAFVGALITPAHERSDGTRISPVIAQLTVRLTYPSYLAREATWMTDPTEMRVPAGTTLDVHVTPRFAAERGRILAGDQAVTLTLGTNSTLVGRYTVQAEAKLRFEIARNGVRYEDPRSLSIQVEPDAAPSIRIVEPESGRLAPPTELLSLRYSASDDVGVANIQLHARVEGGAEKQQMIFSALDDGGPKRELRASASVLPAELGASEGDTLVLWLEARDNDLVNGPHIGRSQEIVLEVAQPGKGLSELIPTLQQLADTAVDLLGFRLDEPVTKDAEGGKQRQEVLQRAGRSWLSQVDMLLRRVEDGGGQAPLGMDVDQIRGLRKRNDKLLTSEAGLYAPALRSFVERSAADLRHVEELERDVVLLADMLARAHVDEAKAIADELRSLKKHIEDLLSELENKPSPEAERALMQEIAKAQRRLAELAQSLSRMATRVPSEFVNRDALSKEAAETELASLERAVKDHDLRSAAQHLDALAKQIDDLAAQIGQGSLRLQESRFGPRDQAMAQARQKLGMLGAEQDRLTDRSSEVMRSALDRGQRGMPDSHAESLAPRAEALGKTAAELAQSPGSGEQTSSAYRATERLRDARDALRAGDLSQARGMAQSAESSLRETAAELESEARVFPGRDATRKRAGQARQAVAEAEQLTDDIDRAMPNVSDHMNDGERQRVRADAESQRATADAAEQLQRQFEQGPDGLPLSPEATERLQAAQKAMQKAEKALNRGKPDEANRAQQEASQQIKELSDSLAQQQQQGGGRGGKGEKEGSMSEAPNNSHVRIPGTEAFQGPTELRRKLLDAMQEAAPSGYEPAIKRYYQELMR
jgi:hypothetical protein